MIMAIALESFGFFYWVAAKLLQQSKGSGIKLFWLTNLLCFLMTIFLNNDGSILITTPILLLVLKYLGLKKHQKTPYLLSGVLIATASSAPIGVSNIVNLISLKIIGMDLYLHTAMMFVPSMMGLIFMTCLLFMFFYKRLPKSLPDIPGHFQSLRHRRHSSSSFAISSFTRTKSNKNHVVCACICFSRQDESICSIIYRYFCSSCRCHRIYYPFGMEMDLFQNLPKRLVI